MLVSPLRKRRRESRTYSGATISIDESLAGRFRASCPLPVVDEEADAVLVPDESWEGDQYWVRRLYEARPWRGWSAERQDGPHVRFDGVDPIDVEPPRVTVVVTIYNQPDRFVPCLRTITERTVYPNYDLVVIDDGSDPYSSNRIKEVAPEAKVFSHINAGYLNSANRGGREAFRGGADYVVFVNSDVRVTHGWLSAMVRATIRTGADLVNPLCNQQGPISLPLAFEKSWGFPRIQGGVGYRQAAVACSFVPPSYPDAITSVGQCMMVSRSAWENHGPFDGKIYGTGYGEECELWARVISDGGKAVVADDAYVYHESHATHRQAEDREKQGAKTFMARWGDLYSPRAYQIRLWPQRCAKVRATINEMGPAGIPVRFIMMNIGQYGGVYCVLRLVDELNERGFDASAHFVKMQEHDFKLTTGPRQYSDTTQLRRMVKDPRNQGGFIVATHWYTGEIMKAMGDPDGVFTPIAFWQDREDLFTEPNGQKSVRPMSVDAYTPIPNRIVNAEWVGRSAVSDLGIDGFTHIPVGVDTDKFYPQRRKGGPVRILAMHRPSTPRRGAKRLLSLYLSLKDRYGSDVSFETFGEPCSWSDFHYGRVSQDEVAALMRQIDIVVEPSEYQGFGLPGLEAIACGACLVSTDNRGIHEYGKHRQNCLIESGKDLLDLICEAVDSQELRDKLGEAGRATSLSFDWSVIADRWRDHLLAIKPVTR